MTWTLTEIGSFLFLAVVCVGLYAAKSKRGQPRDELDDPYEKKDNWGGQ